MKIAIVPAKKPRTELKESTSLSGKNRLDRAAGLVRGVKVLGKVSTHGYIYPDDVMRNAIPLYEGIRVNVNHPRDRSRMGAARDYEDRFGSLRNVRLIEGRGLFADFKYNRGHRLAAQFEDDVENDPENVGFSHNGGSRRNLREQGGKQYVESIDYVYSVDLVADPATTRSLFESKGKTMKVLKKKSRKGSNDPRTRLLEAAAMMDEAGLEGSGDTASCDEAMGNLIKSIFLDPDLDAAAKKTKIIKILAIGDDTPADEGKGGKAGAEDRGRGKGKKSAKQLARELIESDDEDEDDEDDDSEDVAARLARMEKRDQVKELCEDVGFKPSSTEMAALTALRTDAQVKELIESLSGKKGKGGKAGAEDRGGQSGAKSRTPEGGTKSSYANSKEFAAGLC